MDDPAAVFGADVGGTFTDLVCWDGRRLRTGKTATTPDQSEGLVAGAVELADATGVRRLLHGTTVATNALLERAGAPVALITTAGFEDVVEIGRQDRPSLYDPFVDRPEPLVPRSRRFGLVDRDGRVIFEPPDFDAEAVAVSLLYSYADPAGERHLAEMLRDRGFTVSASSDVVAEFREFERTSTTVLNAYLTPIVARYLKNLGDRAAAADLPGDVEVMRSSGGLIDVATAARLPAAILLSGPAGGVVAAAELGRVLGRDRLVSFDMGGTSTDVCRIEEGRPDVAYRRDIDGYACLMPAVAVHTVGAGGGSIAWVDPGGALRVGPRSAGATPGPAAYGRGGVEATVTDADLLIGRVPRKLAGGMSLDVDLARSAVGRIAERLGLSEIDTALGVVEVVEAHMERAVRAVSVEQGADPRAGWLVAFGGAGGMHATALARRLDMAGVVIPPYAGVYSALGLLLSPPRIDLSRSLAPDDELDVALDRLVADARNALDGVREVRTSVDVRYRGQSHETTIDYRPGEGFDVLEARFHEAHRVRNGFARIGDPVEVVTARAVALGTPALRWDDLDLPVPTGETRRGVRPVVTVGGTVDASVWWRPALEPGATVVGPAIIEEPEATTWLASGEQAIVHLSGALEVTW